MPKSLTALASILLAGVASVALGDAATWSFGSGPGAARAETITFADDVLTVDLSGLPAGAKVFRAVLRFRRRGASGRGRETDRVIVIPAGGPDRPLALRRPRCRSLDATAPVAAAVAAGTGTVGFHVKALRWWDRRDPDHTRLDVSFTAAKIAPAGKAAAVGKLTARHREGQTILTWREPAPAVETGTVSVGRFAALREELAAAPRQITYRIYRHRRPITAETIAAAELIDEVGRLTCWNHEFHGISPPKGAAVFRYAVADGAGPVAPGTGIYAHNPAKAGTAYYAVTAAVNGRERFDLPAGAAAGPVAETVGPGPMVLQRVEGPESFYYTKDMTLRYYTRWEAPPRCNLPGRPYDYLVATHKDLPTPAGLDIALHSWGSNLYGKGGGNSSWFRVPWRRELIFASTNQIPYDWYVAYHEGLHTWRCWAEGVTRDYTPRRLFAFQEWIMKHWKVDPDRVLISGGSMGGSGSCMLALRYGGRFAWCLSFVGVHVARLSPQFRGSYESVCGSVAANLPHAGGMKTFDYLDDAHWLRADPARDVPYVAFSNGKNDHGIGWPQAVRLVKAFQETRQPHMFAWGMSGHGQGGHVKLDLRRDRSLPAFTRCSLDDDVGTGTKLPEPKDFKNRWGRVLKDLYDGDSTGRINAHLRWQTETIVDEPDRWEITVLLASGKGGAPEDACTVDITPRRLQKLKVRPGQSFTWTAAPVGDGGKAASGDVKADKWGLVTLERVTVTRDGTRVRIAR